MSYSPIAPLHLRVSHEQATYPQRNAKPGKMTHAEAQSNTIPSGRMYQMARPAPEASWRVIRQREISPKKEGGEEGSAAADREKESNERHSGHGGRSVFSLMVGVGEQSRSQRKVM